MRRRKAGKRGPIRRHVDGRRIADGESRFRALVRHTTDVIMVLDAAGAIRYVSPAVEAVLGYRPEERLDGSAFDRIHPDDAPAVRRLLAQILTSPGVVAPLALRLRHRDGSWRHVEGTATNLLADPAVGGLVVNYRDVTARRVAEEARAASERLFRVGFDRSVLGIALADTAGTILASNPALQRLLGYDAAGLRGLGLRDLTHPDDLAPNLDLLADLLAGRRGHYTLEKRYRHRAGHVVWVRLTVSAIPDAAGHPRFLVVMVEDISERKDAEAALQRQNAYLSALHDTTLALLHRREPEALLQDIVARAGALVGTPDGYLYLLGPGDDAMTVRVGVGIFRDGVDNRIRRGEGLGGRVWATGRPLAVAEYDTWPGRKAAMAPGRFRAIVGVPLTAGGAVVGVIGLAYAEAGRRFEAEDLAILGRFGALASLALENARLHDAARRELAEREATEVRLAHQATHDPLSGLPNRALFMDRLGQGLARMARQGGRLAVLFLDLDRFKVVNDSLGHDAGDRLLVAVAARLLGCLRPGDTASRLGGDEFTILLEDLRDGNEAVMVARALLATLASPVLLDDRAIHVTASVGLAFSTDDEGEETELVRRADVAMYRAKRRGRGRFAVFNPRVDPGRGRPLDLEAELRRALERNEFRVFYEPMVALATGRIAGVEALVRWRHPQRGLLSPMEFIALAEETDLILALDRWVLAEACRHAQRWRGPGVASPPLLSVNLSGRHFQQAGLVEFIARTLRETGTDPGGLQLELTERVFLEQTEATLTALKQLKALGIRLAVDDFGTGYAGLGYLQNFPLDTIKIDRSFVTTLGNDGGAAIVEGVVAMAQGLGVRTVAEGVETATQASRLRELGCDLGQGWHFSRPISSQAMTRLLRHAPQ
jgi:diguanylate cyclase (GGDEF)-like protein/PAS domain S-box-containing protein